jgi:TM2 domain-containing membrane protein YozV
MNCANHPEAPAIAYCRECGKPMCLECRRLASQSVYCAEHEPAPASATPPPDPFPAERQPAASSPYTAPYPPAYPTTTTYDPGAHPALALLLGFIPGVGAIYNGQYAKGLIHAVIFGILVSITNSSHGPLQPLFGIMIAIWIFYMAFEAYHTARKRRYGIVVEEFSSLFDAPNHGKFPGGAVLLVVLGFILLLDTTDIINMDQVERYWPIGLIVLGLYLLYVRVHAAGPSHLPPPPKDSRSLEPRQ